MTQPYQNSGTLTVTNLAVIRGDTPLFSQLSFVLNPGELIWIKGSNGIGKTSLLKCIAGLLRPESGTVKWNGGKLAYQGHRDAHKPNLSALENLEFWQTVFGGDADIKATLKTIGLWGRRHQRAKSLSAGQSRRLSLARLLLRGAPLWIMDEPAASLDAKGRGLIHDLLHMHIDNGGSALLASHAPPDRVGDSTRVLTLRREQNAGD